jgi:hypothetical protein
MRDVDAKNKQTAKPARVEKQVFDEALLKLPNSRAFRLADIRGTKKGQQKKLRQEEPNR